MQIFSGKKFRGCPWQELHKHLDSASWHFSMEKNDSSNFFALLRAAKFSSVYSIIFVDSAFRSTSAWNIRLAVFVVPVYTGASFAQ